MDPDGYYGLFVDDTPVLYPNGSYVKKGDTIVRNEIVEAVDGRPFDLRLVTRGPDITDDGEVYWVSFENEDLRVTKAMGELVLELLDPDEQYKLFTVVGKAANEPLAPVIEEEGVSEHRIKGKTVVRGDQVSTGALYGIDQQIWERGREYLVFIRYELRPLPEQKGEPGPMFTPEEYSEFANCFVRCVVSHFQNRMTRAGSGLTPKPGGYLSSSTRSWLIRVARRRTCSPLKRLSRSDWSLSIPWATPCGKVENTRPTRRSLCPVTITTPG